jgi:hypothetical protein
MVLDLGAPLLLVRVVVVDLDDPPGRRPETRSLVHATAERASAQRESTRSQLAAATRGASGRPQHPPRNGRRRRSPARFALHTGNERSLSSRAPAARSPRDQERTWTAHTRRGRRELGSSRRGRRGRSSGSVVVHRRRGAGPPALDQAPPRPAREHRGRATRAGSDRGLIRATRHHRRHAALDRGWPRRGLRLHGGAHLAGEGGNP